MLRRLINILTFSKPKWGPKAPAGSNLVSSTSQRIGVLSSGEPGGRDPGCAEGFLTSAGLGVVFMGEKNLWSKTGLVGTLTEL